MTLVLAQSVISLLLSVQPIKIFNIYPLVVLLSFVLMYVQKINIAIFICGLHYLLPGAAQHNLGSKAKNLCGAFNM